MTPSEIGAWTLVGIAVVVAAYYFAVAERWRSRADHWLAQSIEHERAETYWHNACQRSYGEPRGNLSPEAAAKLAHDLKHGFPDEAVPHFTSANPLRTPSGDFARWSYLRDLTGERP